MKVYEQLRQGSDEWMSLRTRYPTASEFHNLLTPKELKPSKSIDKYVAHKLAEYWQRGPMQSFFSHAADQGKILEDAARSWYAWEFNTDIETVGFVVNDANTAGCSPDIFVNGRRRGVQVKCPEANTHVRYIIDGGLPDEHFIQVQGELWVCDLEEWDFLSYRENFPKHLFGVKRDRNVSDALEEAVALFWKKFNIGKARLIEANGGRDRPEVNYSTKFVDGDEVRTLKDFEERGDLGPLECYETA